MKAMFAGLGQPRHPIALLTALALGLAIGYWFNHGESRSHGPNVSTAVEAAGASSKNMLYICPMMCVPPMEKPGRCPVCGMDLVAEPGGAARGGEARLSLTPEEVRRAGIRTAPAERKFVSAEVRLFGRIDYDPAHIANITSFMPGVIDRVYVKRWGAFVRWGEPLFDIYSPDLLATMQQLMEARKHVPSFWSFREGRAHIAREAPVQGGISSGDPERDSEEVKNALKTIEAVRHKLSILGLPKRDIDELMKAGEPTGIATVYSSMYGQVVEQNAFEGAYVNTGTKIMTIADPQYVWARLDAYEVDYPWIRRGQRVTLEVDAYPGETFEGKVVWIYPVFNAERRTFDIGAVVPDSGGRLKAGMLIRAVIHAGLTVDGSIADEQEDLDQAPLVIPASAPLITGKRAVVYVAAPDQDRGFEGREITLGPRAGEHYIVLAGLEAGEEVVVNGNFKIDSSVQILARKSMMSDPGGHPAVIHLPNGSDMMHEDYMKERNQSRLSPPDDRSAHDREKRPGRSPIVRRKPGTYGDTTRRASGLWRQ